MDDGQKANRIWAWTVGIGAGLFLACSGTAILVFAIRAIHAPHAIDVASRIGG